MTNATVPAFDDVAVGLELPAHDKLDQSRPIQALDLAAVGLSAAELKHRDRCLGKRIEHCVRSDVLRDRLNLRCRRFDIDRG